mmetsp:Transcript_24076/g.51749  ORF Transcript_24076/g.51749 Transcript_24076/m.51749 type:complete len:259 (-) Transcript_24076:277-1053(-)
MLLRAKVSCSSSGAAAREGAALCSLARSEAGARRAAARRSRNIQMRGPPTSSRGPTALRVAASSEGTQLDGDFFEPENPNTTAKVTFQLPHSVPFGQEVLITGDSDELGSWSLAKARKLAWQEGDVWRVTVDLPAETSIEYKYAVSKCGDEDINWMPGSNFAVEVPRVGKALVAEDVWGRGGECVRSNGANAAAIAAAAEEQAAVAEAEMTMTTVMGEEEVEDYAKLTVKELKALLKSRGLPVSGKKADLVARLRPDY